MNAHGRSFQLLAKGKLGLAKLLVHSLQGNIGCHPESQRQLDTGIIFLQPQHRKDCQHFLHLWIRFNPRL